MPTHTRAIKAEARDRHATSFLAEETSSSPAPRPLEGPFGGTDSQP
jgi:hypothetical protein